MNRMIRIGVLRGGPSSEYKISLNTGANVLRALREKHSEKYHSHDLLIDNFGQWYFDGVKESIQDILPRVDMIFNALHGSYGEDGKIQNILEIHGIPFTGSGSMASAIGMNKSLTKKEFIKHGIKTPYGKILSSNSVKTNTDTVVRELFQTFILPAIIKPVSAGSSVGVSLIRSYKDLSRALNTASKHGDEIIIEEFIPGIEATCGVIEGFRDQELYALPPIEIRPMTAFFDYEAKYQGKSREIVPASFSHSFKEKLMELARKIHRALGLCHYSRSDFIIHPKRGIYALEVNTLPGLTDESLIPKALRAVGSDTHEFVDHIIQLALNRD
ncbi:MAG: D-alanine--D-alanine ligase [Patescibacteria group bacterium]